MPYPRLQPPHYSSGTRPDGYQFPEITPEAAKMLTDWAAAQGDPYGHNERRALRRATEASKARCHREQDSAQQGASRGPCGRCAADALCEACGGKGT